MSDFIGTKLTMNLGERSYDIILKNGALENLYQFARLDRKVAVVTDSGVPAEYAQRVADQCRESTIITVPQGEASKSFKILETVLRQMLEFNMGRGDLVVAVGGGVVGDLAGFAAAIYMRGIDFINCPTTTLSMIDSSIGGKTAVDLGDTKNIVGAFWQPKLVIVDPATLSTLPRRHYINGLAEAVKAGLLADPELFAIFEKGDIDTQINEIIYRSLRFKKNVVEQDETERGMRKALNFGHTIGHGIVFQQAEPHLHMRVLLAELVQLGLQSGQVVRHQRHADADAHRLCRLDLGPQGGLHLLELLHYRRGMALQAHAAVGKGELVVGAEEQRPAQLGFQRRDALPQCLP